MENKWGGPEKYHNQSASLFGTRMRFPLSAGPCTQKFLEVAKLSWEIIGAMNVSNGYFRRGNFWAITVKI